MLRIFISSTSKDLTAHREAVRKAVTGLKMYPVMMEDFAATDSNAVEKCHREVRDGDIFLALYAHRYGFIPPDETKSITELEYEWATQARKPRLIYVVDPAYEWADSLRDDDPAPLERFKQRVGLERVWKTFTTPESLAAAVTQGLAELERPVTLRSQRRQLVTFVVGVGILLLALFVGLTAVLHQQQIALQPTPTVTPTPIATAVLTGADREVLVVLTKFDQVGGSEEDPAVAWERTMQKPIRDVKNANVRVVRYNNVIHTEEEAKTLASQLRATIVIWGWTYSDVSLTTRYTITPQWGASDAQPDETQIDAAPNQKIDVTIARGADTEYVLNFVLGQLEYFGADEKLALPYLERCIQLAPAGREKEMGLGAVYFYHGVVQHGIDNNSDAVLADFSKAIDIDPTFFTAIYDRGLSYYELQDYDRALIDFNKAIQLNPNDADSYVNRGQVFYRQQNYNGALTDFNKAIQLDPTIVTAYYNRGNTFFELKRYPESLKDYDKAIQLSPNERNYYNNRGLAYLKQQDFANALKDFNKSIEIDPAYVRPYVNRGDLYSQQKEFDKALKDLTKAIELDPNRASAYFLRGSVYEQLQRYADALADYKQYIQLVPDDPEVLQAIKDIEARVAALTPTPTASS